MKLLSVNPEYKVIEVVKELVARAEYTPDFKELRDKTDIPVFVYGTLKRGYHNNSLLRGSKYIGEAETCFARYTLFSTGGFPVLNEVFGKENKNNDMVGRVKGEVFLVDLNTLARLDQLEANGHMYSRSEKHVYLRDQTPKVKGDGAQVLPHMKAWAYVGIKDYFQWDRLHQLKPYTEHNRSYLSWGKEPS